MEDKTFELKAKEQQKQQGAFTFLFAPQYNIDDMDPGVCMISLKYTGCFCLRSAKNIDPLYAGMVYIDGVETEAPIIEPSMPMFGQLVALKMRKYLTEYDREYDIKYSGARYTDGEEAQPYSFKIKTLPKSKPGEKYPEHDALVLQAAEESAVLLTNDGTLPLGKGATVNVFGKGAVVFRSGCLGAGKINPRYAIRVKDGINLTTLKLNEELYEFYKNEQDILPNYKILKNAIKKSDTAVVFITRSSSEAHDMSKEVGGYLLTEDERQLIKSITKTFNKTVAVLNTAYPIDVQWVEEYGVNAVLWTGLCGMAGGLALARILEGSANPSGKLACTWARAYKDYPSAKNFLTKEDLLNRYGDLSLKYSAIFYEEGMYVGYRYFTSFEKTVAYMFGHGLSYTVFEKKVKEIKHENYTTELFVEVKNIGKAAGKEVVAIYAEVNGRLEQPKKKLVAFAKTKLLLPEESDVLELTVTPDTLASYSEEQQAWVFEKGEIVLSLGGAADKTNDIYVMQTEDCIFKQSKNILENPVDFEELTYGKKVKGGKTRAFRNNESDGLPYAAQVIFPEKTQLPFTYSGDVITFEDVKKDENLLTDFVAQLDDYCLARITVGGKTGWGVGEKGYAGALERGGALEKYKLPEYYLSDGNNGLNLAVPNVGFPTSGAMCSSWNVDLMYAEGKAIAKEAIDENLHCILAPAMNIQRNPLCGRHSEYFSEDPYLAGVMAGYQSKGIEEGGVSSSIKHFFANNCELMRGDSNSIMKERTAREIYLKAFEYAFMTHMPDTVMTSYNAVNGVYPADNYKLLTEYLRGEIGFKGYVMTDWNGYGNKGFASLIKAGVNLITPGSPDDSIVNHILESLKNGEITRAELQQSVITLLKEILK